MTVQTNTNVASFNGNGVTQIFPIAFKFNNATDLVVLRIDDATGTATQLALNSDYTVSGEGDEEGGLINVVVAPASGQRLKVTRVVDILQLTDLRNQGKFFAEVHEDAFDLLTMIAQQHESGIRSSLRVAESDPEPARIPAVALRAGKLLAFDDSGNPIAVVPTTDSSAQLRIDLASSSGAGLVGFSPTETVAQALTRVSAVFITSSQYDLVSLENGRTDSALNAAAWEAMRAEAESLKATVIIEAGTYILPPQVKMDADNTVWIFRPGAVLKLHDTQATNDFITFSAPVNQRVHGLRVDANRASQVPATFGVDNCACIVVDASGCVFEDTEIVSSPAKGFALVSSAGGTNRDVEIRGFKAADCDMQALLVDGNNMTGFFERITITGVRIGATSHAGVALNDGAHDITMSNVIADVQNSTWDAVFIRDSWDIQCSNVRGKRGRNGVQVQRLNGFCGRIQLDNVVGELSAQNGVLFLGVENVTGGAVTGRNNGAAGINVAATSDGYRCKNINIAAPCGYDDRATTAQQWGILVQGVDGCRLGKHIAFGNTTRNVSINRSATSAVEADIYRVVEVATGSIAATSQAAITATFAETMDDATNDVQAYVTVGTTGRSLAVGHVASRTASAVQILVHNLHGSVAQEGTLVVRVTRRP